MDEKSYKKRIAQLESLNDQLTAEFDHLDGLLKQLGFEEGISTLKDAADEMLDKQNDDKAADA